MTTQQRPIITFLSDFGTTDGYAGSVKGILKRSAPQAEIVDVSHELPPFNIPAAAFALLNYYQQYPPGTVHLVVVDPGVGGARSPIILQTQEYYFVGPDNGVFHFVEEREKWRKYQIIHAEPAVKQVSSTFHGRDIFAPAAAILAGGGEIQNIAEEILVHTNTDDSGKSFIKRNAERLEISALSIDHFGNIVTALSKEEFSKYNNRLRYIEVNKRQIPQISAFYEQHPHGELLALWNSLNLLEIAVNQGSAAEQLQFDLNRDKVYIYLSQA